MIGRIIEEDGQKVVQTLAGATAGTVCKVNYGSDSNYAIPITLNEVGEGYVGISCVCPGPFYNPATGTLTVDNICSISSEAENANKVKSNSLSGDTVYNLAIWCATSDGCYNSMGFSGGRSITYNPYTATLNACCGNFNNSLYACRLTVDTANVSTTGLSITQNTNTTIGEIDGSGQLVWCNPVIACLCGNATSATGTSTYNHYCAAGVYNNCLFNVGLLTGSADCTTLAYSTCCTFLQFNPMRGILRIADGFGENAGTFCVDTLCVGTGGISTKYDVYGSCVDGDDEYDTWYIYCDGSACFDNNMSICGDLNVRDAIYQGNYEVIDTCSIQNYLSCQCRVSLETYLACSSLCSNVLYLVY